ncbi:MAG: hypothetical protein F7B60_04585 [Desulfurococcales archaeon]|nr:hypothetical protein [Desulfurococcales archaeon]
MIKTYSNRVKDSIDVQFNNIIIDTEPNSFGLNKIARPISIKGFNSSAKEILTEVVLAAVNPADKIKLSISINGIIITREVRPTHITDYGGLYWMSTVYDATELLRNRLNPLYQTLKIYYQGSDVRRFGYVSMLAAYNAEDMETTYTYASGLEKISYNQVYRLAQNLDFNRNKITDLQGSHLMTYSRIPLEALEICKTSKGCINTPVKHGFSELKFRDAFVKEVSLRSNPDPIKHSVLLTNHFNFYSSTSIPVFKAGRYSKTKSPNDGSTIVNIEFSVKEGTGEGRAQFILIDEGIPVGRLRRKVKPGSNIVLSFNSRNALKKPIIRVLFFKYSKNWIFDYRLE